MGLWIWFCGKVVNYIFFLGGENYVDFIRMLTSVFVMLLVQILTLTLQLVIIEAKEQPQSEMKTL